MNEESIIQKEEIIQELRKRMESVMPPDMYDDPSIFYRFLKARDFNLDNAEKMLIKHVQWRKEKKVDTILTDFKRLEVFEKYFSYSRIGFDKDGSLCRYMNFGNLDVKGFHMSSKLLDFEMTVIQDYEMDIADMKERNKKFGSEECRMSSILNCEMISFATVTDKQEGWKEEFRKIFDPDELPAFLGGDKTDPDGNPLCETFICHGEKIPEQYHVHKNKKSIINAPGTEKIILPRASFHEMNIEVVEPQSLIEWEFETKNRDIGFGVFYQETVDGEERVTELISLQRIDTEMYAEKGIYRCEKAGTYILLFDNTYSWIRAKEIYFRVAVVTPKNHQAELEEET